MLLFVFWLRNMPSIKYVCNSRNGGGGVIQNVYRFIQEERGITPHVYLCTYRQLLFSCICLKVSCSSVVRHSTKICVKKMKEKYVTFTVGKSKFLQNQRGEGDFSAENLGLFFHSSGNVKKQIITRN